MKSTSPPTSELITQAHQLYCELTGQRLQLRYDRERAWFELLWAGFTLEDVHRVIGYLQREIRSQRRNVGALKLSNLLQVDQFEEDLNISRVRLRPLPAAPVPPKIPESCLPPEQQARHRESVGRFLDQLRESLRSSSRSPTETTRHSSTGPS